MPSSAHEALVEIVRQRPAVVAELLTAALGVELPVFDEAVLEPAEIVDLSPTEYRADAVVALADHTGPVGHVVVEVQLRPDPDKPWTWPMYLATLRARHRRPVLLLVVCIDLPTAAWAATAIELGHPGHVLVPLVLGPDRIPQDPAAFDGAAFNGTAELAVLAALAHGRHRTDVLDSLATALGAVETEQALMYLRLVLSALPQAARTHLETLMTTETFDYQSEFTDRLRDEGRVAAKVDDVLRVLRVRGIAVPDQVREQITACTDLDRLDAWHDRAITARGIDDLDI